jgi:hypothetical protein
MVETYVTMYRYQIDCSVNSNAYAHSKICSILETSVVPTYEELHYMLTEPR